jgi:hypothetical protein
MRVRGGAAGPGCLLVLAAGGWAGTSLLCYKPRSDVVDLDVAACPDPERKSTRGRPKTMLCLRPTYLVPTYPPTSFFLTFIFKVCFWACFSVRGVQKLDVENFLQINRQNFNASFSRFF